jgi:hypothetical protein
MGGHGMSGDGMDGDGAARVAGAGAEATTGRLAVVAGMRSAGTSAAAPVELPPHIRAGLAALDAAERAFLFGVFTLGGDRSALTTALDGEAGLACTSVLLALEQVSRPERARAMADLGRDLPSGLASHPSSALASELAPELPSGFAGVHLDWVRAALEDVPSRDLRILAHDGPAVLRAAVAALFVVRGEAAVDVAPGGSPPAPLDAASAAWGRHLRRALFHDIVPVPDPRPDQPRVHGWRALLGLGAPTRERLLTGLGIDVLGGSLLGAAAPVIERAAAYVGARLAPRLRARATGSPTAEDATLARDDLGRPEAWPALFAGMDATDRQWSRKLVAATPTAGTAGETLERLGARVVGEAITRARPDADLARAVAQRLCLASGRELLAGAGLLAPAAML